MYPVVGHVYTYREICEKLTDLRDIPYLMVYLDGAWQPIQMAGVTDEVLLADQTFAQSEWEFIEETYEWIPVFHFWPSVDDESSIGAYDIVEWSSDRHYIYPKGHVIENQWGGY